MDWTTILVAVLAIVSSVITILLNAKVAREEKKETSLDGIKEGIDDLKENCGKFYSELIELKKYTETNVEKFKKYVEEDTDHRAKTNRQVGKLAETITESQLKLIRCQILQFATKLREFDGRGTYEEFQCVFDLINNYEKYCLENPNFKNNMVNQTVEYIKRCSQNPYVT